MLFNRGYANIRSHLLPFTFHYLENQIASTEYKNPNRKALIVRDCFLFFNVNVSRAIPPPPPYFPRIIWCGLFHVFKRLNFQKVKVHVPPFFFRCIDQLVNILFFPCYIHPTERRNLFSRFRHHPPTQRKVFSSKNIKVKTHRDVWELFQWDKGDSCGETQRKIKELKRIEFLKKCWQQSVGGGDGFNCRLLIDASGRFK